jgi:ABC-type multidrug transport system ATPase subunit
VTAGQIFFNEHEHRDIDIKGVSGFVPQDDILMETMTTRECLTFSARLRLTGLSDKVQDQRVEKILEELGIQHCADTRLGGNLVRGVSGGEKKRASIGYELIADPAVLFLDEPTTGLDSSTASKIIRIIKLQAERTNRTILATIHQPSSDIYSIFDKLLLLSDGRAVF